MTTATESLEDQDFLESGPAEAVRLPLDLIDANPANPRRALVEVEALADNIRTFGLLQPVTVRRQGDRYELLGGHRRRAAFLVLRDREPHDVQWRTIPAVIRSEESDDRAFLMLLSSQLHNRNWHAREEAAALERLVLGGRTLQQVGEALNRTEGWASRRLRVYADSVLSSYVQLGELSTGVAEEFLPVLDVGTRKQFAERAITEGWTQDQARGAVRALRADRQLREVSKQSKGLRALLSQVDASLIPDHDATELLRLARLIMRLAKREGPRFPSIEQAERMAKVDQSKTPKRRLKRVKVD